MFISEIDSHEFDYVIAKALNVFRVVGNGDMQHTSAAIWHVSINVFPSQM